MIKSLSPLLLGRCLFGINSQALELHGFTFLSRDSSLVILYFLVVLRDSLFDFMSKLFTSLMGLVKLGQVLGVVLFLRVRQEAELDLLVVVDDSRMSQGYQLLATLFSSCKLVLNLSLSFHKGIRVISLLALIHFLVMIGHTLLDFSSFLETKFLSSCEFGLIALSLEGDVVRRIAVFDLQVVLPGTLDSISSSLGSTSISSSKLGVHGLFLKNFLGLLVADSPLTCQLDSGRELEGLQILLALGGGLILLHGDLFEGVALLVRDESELEGSRWCFTLGLLQVDLEFNCGCGRVVHL